MALNEEFGNIADRRIDANASFSSAGDISRAASDDLGGREDAREAFASDFEGRADAATGDMVRRADAAGIESSRSQDSLMADLVAYAQGAGDRDAAISAFSALDRAHAERFLATAGALLGSSEKAELQASFDARFKAPASIARAAVPAVGDALLGTSDSVVGDAWKAGRDMERAAKTVKGLGAGRGGAAAALGAAIDQGDEDNALRQGMETARGAKATYRVGSAAKRALEKRKTAPADNSALSAKRKSMEIAKAAKQGRVVNSMGLMARLKVVASSVGAAISNGLGSIAAMLAPALPALGAGAAALMAVVVVIVILFGGGSGAGATAQVPGMNEVESQVYSFFSEKGLDDVHIAAIMGNMKGESGMNPAMVEHYKVINDRLGWTDDQLLSYKGSDGCGIGLCQWSFGRRVKLIRLSQSTGRDWRTDVGLQLDFFWNHDIWQQNWGSGANTKAKFLATDDLEAATTIFMRGWEVAGVERLQERIDNANGYLSMISAMHAGQNLSDASQKQKDVVRSCVTTPSPGKGLCAWWVSDVFERAGLGGVSGNADDMYYAWCTSSNRAELKVGMIVAVPKHGKTSAGMTYGHVGVYIGDGKLMDNIGPIRTIELDEWLSFYGDISTPKWGWANGIDLSKK